MAEHHVTREDEIDGILRTATRAVERVKKDEGRGGGQRENGDAKWRQRSRCVRGTLQGTVFIGPAPLSVVSFSSSQALRSRIVDQ
jgi:hypothetical protein